MKLASCVGEGARCLFLIMVFEVWRRDGEILASSASRRGDDFPVESWGVCFIFGGYFDGSFFKSVNHVFSCSSLYASNFPFTFPVVVVSFRYSSGFEAHAEVREWPNYRQSSRTVLFRG